MSGDVHRQGGRDPHDVLGVPRGADRQQVMRARLARLADPNHGRPASSSDGSCPRTGWRYTERSQTG
jgi:hypothetical protein